MIVVSICAEPGAPGRMSPALLHSQPGGQQHQSPAMQRAASDGAQALQHAQQQRRVQMADSPSSMLPPYHQRAKSDGAGLLGKSREDEALLVIRSLTIV